MQSITLPKKTKVIETGENSGKFVIEECYPGYGTTLGNALRRVLLSSLDGAAVTAIKIKGVSHEFSTIEGILEDVVQIILNVKKIRFKFFGEEPVRLTLSFNKGKGEITAKEIKCTSDVEIVNGDQLIATATSAKSSLEMEVEIARGLGYVPVDQQAKREELGWINIDSIYTPIKRVNYEIENMRVGKRTDFDRIVLEIVTDGSIKPEDAFNRAVKILVDQFSVLAGGLEEASEGEDANKVREYEAVLEEEKKANTDKSDEEDITDLSIEELKGLSTRTVNALKDNKIKKVKGIIKLSNEELEKLEGLGEKGVKEIKKAIGSLGLILKNK